MVRGHDLADVEEHRRQVGVDRVEHLHLNVGEGHQLLDEILAHQLAGETLGAAGVHHEPDLDTLARLLQQCAAEGHAKDVVLDDEILQVDRGPRLVDQLPAGVPALVVVVDQAHRGALVLRPVGRLEQVEGHIDRGHVGGGQFFEFDFELLEVVLGLLEGDQLADIPHPPEPADREGQPAGVAIAFIGRIHGVPLLGEGRLPLRILPADIQIGEAVLRQLGVGARPGVTGDLVQDLGGGLVVALQVFVGLGHLVFGPDRVGRVGVGGDVAVEHLDRLVGHLAAVRTPQLLQRAGQHRGGLLAGRSGPGSRRGARGTGRQGKRLIFAGTPLAVGRRGLTAGHGLLVGGPGLVERGRQLFDLVLGGTGRDRILVFLVGRQVLVVKRPGIVGRPQGRHRSEPQADEEQEGQSRRGSHTPHLRGTEFSQLY